MKVVNQLNKAIITPSLHITHKILSVMSVFWLTQKAVLFEETPLIVLNGTRRRINSDALVASENIYGLLARMQSVAYPSFKC